MFEKEAKERAKDFTDDKKRQIAYECGFLDGSDRMRGEMQKLKKDYEETEKLLDKQIEETYKLFEENKELEKENVELETRIERMMCCGNCIYFDFNEPNYCHKGVYRERLYVCDKWKFGN